MKSKTFQFILIAIMIVIDAWFFHGVYHNNYAASVFFALVTHFGVAIYYYQKQEKSRTAARPFQAYSYLGFFLPWLSVAICENVSEKNREKVDAWVAGVFFFMIILFVIAGFVFFE